MFRRSLFHCHLVSFLNDKVLGYMGHRGFGERSRVTEKKTATEEDKYSCTPDVPARSCFEDMVLLNGTRELTEEQLSEARRCRDEFRDDVSRRMGDLLLRGMTMLDVYCEVCNGILMENRDGVRNCVTCELFNERTKEGSRLVAEVPLDVTADGVTPGNVLLATEKPQRGQDSVRIVDVERKLWVEGSAQVLGETSAKPNESTTHDTVDIRNTLHHVYQDLSDGELAVYLAVNRKLKWACELLDRCENQSEIRELFALISEGLKILASLRPGFSTG